MLKAIETLQKTRTALFKLTEGLSIEQLNKVPAGFNNNIVWNIAHIVAAQQGVCYLRAGLKTVVDEQFYLAYKPDTKPGEFIDAEQLEEFKQLAFSTLDQLIADFDNNLFANYVPWTTRYGVDINSIEEAINFLPFHDGLHMGYIMALKRAVNAGL
ncbi:MAG: DinB family protein [Sphingobacteriales bacterium]|nr:MAG: DinB family protein [Sphingobacteriales bacterium]